MNILLVHNTYQQQGGEDGVFVAERALLAVNGCQVATFLRDNGHIGSIPSRLCAALNVSYSGKLRKEMNSFLAQHKINIAHVHNFFPVLTPSIYDALKLSGVPVIQTLHNFRTICPGALLMRNGSICEKCIVGTPYQAVCHKCYRSSRLGTLAVARMVAYHRRRDTWGTKVDRFIALTEFGRRKFIDAGFPAHKTVVKPNFYSGKGIENHAGQNRSGALFVGRINLEKGIRTLIAAWRQVSLPLKVVGSGPLLDEIHEASLKTVTILGHQDAMRVAAEMAKADFLVMPSEWYEGFPMVLVEAFAHGLPVVVSKLGSMAEIVEDGVTGLHFEPGNTDDLAAKVRWMQEHPDECRQMGYNARRRFELNYTPERNYEMLMRIYREAIDEKKYHHHH